MSGCTLTYKQLISGQPSTHPLFREEVTISRHSPAMVFKAFGSLLPSTSPPDGKPRSHVAQGEESKQSKKISQEDQSASDRRVSIASMNASGISVRNGSSASASLAKVQVGFEVQAAEQPIIQHNKQHVLSASSAPETIHYSLESDAASETVASAVEQTNQIITHVSSTKTEVEEQKSVDVQQVEQSTTAVQQETVTLQNVSASQTSASVRQYETESPVQNEAQKNASFYQGTHSSGVTETGQSLVVYSSTSKAVDARLFAVPSKRTFYSTREHFFDLERLHREEKDRIVAMMTDEYEDFRRLCHEQFEAFQMENERLVREISTAATRINLLETQLASRPEVTGSQGGKVVFNITNVTTITTAITTITTTITTVNTRIEQWKQIISRNNGQLTITGKELEQISSDLATTTARVTELQQQYAELSKYLSSVNHELEVALSIREEKDHTIASLTAEIAQWKTSDSANAKRITTIRRENESLRHDLSTASSRIAELLQSLDAQSLELTSVRNELRTKTSLIVEKDRTIASITAEVTELKKSDTTKTGELTVVRRDYEKLQKDFSATSSQTVELQKRYEAQSTQLTTVQTKLKTSKSLVTEKERVITTLTAEVDQWKRSDTARAEQTTIEHEEKVKLQQDIAVFSARTTELQQRFEVQSKEIISIRTELQSKVSVLEEREHRISSLATEIEQVRREDSVKVEQITSARSEIEQLRVELASASSRFVELQQRYEVQTKELTTVRNELHRIDILYRSTDQSQSGSSGDISVLITAALEKKNKEIEELHQHLVESSARNAELQKSYEALSREVSTIRDEFKVKTSQSETTITTLTSQVEQWKRSDSTKSEQISITLKKLEKLEEDLSVSTSRFTELQSRYEAQSREFISVRKEFQEKTSYIESRDRTIASLTAEIDHWKSSEASSAEQIATTLKQIEKLQRDLAASTFELAELQGRYEAQSRELASVRRELQTKVSLQASRDETILKLTESVEEWKHSDVAKTEQIAITIKQVEKLQGDLSVSIKQVSELRDRYEEQSHVLITVREELQTKTTAYEETSRKVVSLTSQVEEYTRTDLSKTEELTVVNKDLEKLRLDLATASSQLVQFKQRYESESVTSHEELEHVRHDLSIQIREYESKATELISQIEQWKHSDSTKSEELISVREKVEQLQIELSMSSSRITEFRERYESQSTELATLRQEFQIVQSLVGEKDRAVGRLTEQIEQWKRADLVKADDLTRAHRDVEQLQLRLSASSTQIEELEKYYAEQISIVKHSSSVSEKSTVVQQKIISEVKDYAAVIKLTSTVDRWLHADARRAEELAIELEHRRKENEELRIHLATLKELYIQAPVLKEIFQSRTVETRTHEESTSESVDIKSAVSERHSYSNGVVGFITGTADAYTDTTIVETLEKLNTEIQRGARFMAECIMKDFQPRAAKLNQEQTSAVHRASVTIGYELENCLGRKERDDVALFLPIAFQAYLVYHLRSLISSWTNKKEYNELINKTYEQLQKSEPQATSGRWRSLTRTYIWHAAMGDPKILVSNTLQGLSDVVVAAGCPSHSAAKAKVTAQFTEKVSSIISIACELSKMIAEVVSADFDVVVTRPQQVFEESTMEYDQTQGIDAGTATNHKVLCSTRLGMSKHMQLESEKSETLTVVKTRVVFESAVHDHDHA